MRQRLLHCERDVDASMFVACCPPPPTSNSQGRAMKRLLAMLSLIACAIACIHSPAWSQAAPAVTLTRLECGTGAAPTDVGGRMSDTYAYSGLKVQLTFSCYLIKHGDDYMVWDTGNPVGTTATAPKTSLVDLLAQLKLTPDQVKYVGISHYHGDHVGQVS